MVSTKQERFSNQQIADIFREIADLLEIKGDVIYKILAYRKAADSIADLSEDIYTIWQDGKLTEIPGVGSAIAKKIDEILQTGKLDYLEKLESEVPPSLIELLSVPDVGPKKASLFWREAGVTNLEELKAAAEAGKLRNLPGMGEKSEARILAGIAALSRRSKRIPLGKAWPFAEQIIAYLKAVPGVEKVEIAGSLRRMKETVGDLDILAAAEESKAVIAAFTQHPDVLRVLSQGEVKASVEYYHNMRAQLWVHSPDRFGTALQYATGSKDHNVRLRELALKQSLSLSEQAFTKKDGTEILCDKEKDVYNILGLPWIPPELREDRGEIQAAISNNLPNLVKISDIQSELHCHTTYSDGKLTIKDMAIAAIERGKRVLAITDHSSGLGVAGGLSIDDLHNQREEINQVKKEIGNSLLLLQGCEVEIRADGTLDFPDEILAELDIVIAALHTGLRQPREKVTERMLNAIRNPYVDIIAHPTGRMIPNREGADLNLEQIFSEAAKYGVALEINSHPSRLDLNDIAARRAVEMGVLLAIDTDAHSAQDLDLLQFGVATARRGWVEAKDVINSWEPKELLTWLHKRGRNANANL